MFIKLTNATPAHKGNCVAINTQYIVSLFSDRVERQLDETTTSFEDVTFVFCPPHGTWEVQETVDEITTLISKVQK